MKRGIIIAALLAVSLSASAQVGTVTKYISYGSYSNLMGHTVESNVFDMANFAGVVTNINIVVITNLQLYVSNSIITNINITNNITGLTQMPAAWDADSIHTNTLFINVNSQSMVRVDSNGITMLHGTLQMYEEDLSCNVRLWGGTRLSPSLTFQGHTNEWGLYDRGYNGHTIAGWSVAGTEIGLLWNGGIKLMTTNGVFDGRHIGDLSGCTGYPEPVFISWQTNMQFSYLTLSNLNVIPGVINVKDNMNVVRSLIDTTGLTVKDAGGTSRAKWGGGNCQINNTSGLKTTQLDTSLKLYDAPSGQVLMDVGSSYGDSIIQKTPAGYTQYQLDPNNGLQIADQGLYFFRTKLAYNGLWMLNLSSQTIFQVDSTAGLTTINNLSITNSGNINMYGANGTNLFTVTGSTGAIKVRGQDSDARYIIVNTNWFSGVMTNLFGGKTNVCKYQYGSLTNMTTL